MEKEKQSQGWSAKDLIVCGLWSDLAGALFVAFSATATLECGEIKMCGRDPLVFIPKFFWIGIGLLVFGFLLQIWGTLKGK